MKIFISIVILLTLITSCDKVKRTKKDLFGEWEIISHKISDVNGFTTYYETTGTITFGELSQNSFTYSENYFYNYPNGIITSVREGDAVFNDESGDYYDLTISSPGAEELKNCRIILITKDDLKLEQLDSGGIHIYILKKV